MLRLLSRLDRTLVVVELAVMIGGLAMILAAVSANVVSRTFALPWPDLSEPALVGMSVVAFIGSAYAVQTRNHIVVDLGDLVPAGRWRQRTAWFVDVSIVVLSALVLVYGSELLTFVLGIDERTEVLRIPIAVPVGCLIGGAALSIFHVVCRLAGVSRANGEPHSFGVATARSAEERSK